MFKNLRELIATMPDEDTCRKYLADARWNGKPVCPYCGHDKVYVIENGKRYKCASKECYKKFSVTVGTIFEASNIPLNKWFTAIYIVSGHKKGISSYQLGKDIGVSQKAGWFMLHRIRELMRPKIKEQLDTIVEIDETYVGGKMKFKHKSVREKAHKENISHTENKTGVIGYLQRDGKLKLNPIDDTKTLKEQVKENVAPESLVITDGLNAYKGLNEYYEGHETVDHKADEYVRGIFHTNGIEGSFSLFKRMIIGIYHQTSVKHLSRYCDEFSYRYNSRKMKDAERFNIALTQVEGRLDYKTLVGKKDGTKQN